MYGVLEQPVRRQGRGHQRRRGRHGGRRAAARRQLTADSGGSAVGRASSPVSRGGGDSAGGSTDALSIIYRRVCPAPADGGGPQARVVAAQCTTTASPEREREPLYLNIRVPCLISEGRARAGLEKSNGEEKRQGPAPDSGLIGADGSHKHACSHKHARANGRLSDARAPRRREWKTLVGPSSFDNFWGRHPFPP